MINRKIMTYTFENMRAWQEARKLVVEVYRLLDGFPKFESYALCDQIRRAIVSVPSNLAECSGRQDNSRESRRYDQPYVGETERGCEDCT